MAEDLFSFGSNKSITLEEALKGIVYDNRFVFSLNDTQGNLLSTPGNLLPTKFGENSLEGIFLKDGQLIKSAFGLFDIESPEKACYWYSVKGGFSKQERNSSSLYLPIKFSNSCVTLGFNKDGQFLPVRSSPYVTFGLDSEGNNWPLILMYKDDKKNYKFRGLYYDDEKDYIKYYDRINDIDSNQTAELFIHNLYISILTSLKKGTSNKINITDKKISKIIVKEQMDCSSVKSIIQELKKDVMGQEEALFSASRHFYYYMKRFQNPEVVLPTGHLFFMGPSGSGKTTTAKIFAKKAGIPFARVNASDGSTPGYKDTSFTTVLDTIAQETEDYAPYGIVVVDEVDKLVSDEGSIDNFFAKRKQEILLGWIDTDGIEVTVNGGNKFRKMSTANLLFICLGAFEGYGGDTLARIISKRIGGSLEKEISGFGRTIAASESEENIFKKIIPQDLIKYGLREEMVGRLPFITVFDQLTVEDKIQILQNSNLSQIKAYENFFNLEGFVLKIDPAIYPLIAKKSPVKTGARGLVKVCEELFADITMNPGSFANSNKEIIITALEAEKILSRI